MPAVSSAEDATLKNGHTGLESTEESATGISLRSIDAVAAHVPFIEDARTRVTTEMETMVLTGLTTLVSPSLLLLIATDPCIVQNQSLLASSLQTAFNLRVLPELVQSLLSDLSLAVESRIRSAFDLSKISRDASSKGTTSAPFCATEIVKLESHRASAKFSFLTDVVQVTRENRAYKLYSSTMDGSAVESPREHGRRDGGLLCQGLSIFSPRRRLQRTHDGDGTTPQSSLPMPRVDSSIEICDRYIRSKRS